MVYYFPRKIITNFVGDFVQDFEHRVPVDRRFFPIFLTLVFVKFEVFLTPRRMVETQSHLTILVSILLVISPEAVEYHVTNKIFVGWKSLRSDVADRYGRIVY